MFNHIFIWLRFVFISASSWVSWGIEKGAEKAGHYIRVGSVKIKEKMKAREKDTEVDPRIQQGVQYVRRGTHVAVKVSSYVSKCIRQETCVSVKVSSYVSKYVRQGTHVAVKVSSCQ